MPPLVSVLGPLFNHEKYIYQTLASIRAQTMTDFEAIIVNDGSTDESASIAKEFVQRDNRFRIYHQRNTGVVATMNRLAEKATGRFIATIDSDDFFAPTKLANDVLTMDADARLGATFCSVVTVDAQSNPSNDRKEFASGPISGQEFIEKLIVGDFLASSACLLRASVIRSLSCFARKLEQVWDWDLWLRIAEKSRLQLTGAPGVYIRWDGKNVSRSNLVEGSRMQLIVSHQYAKVLAAKYSVETATWAKVYGVRALHARRSGQPKELAIALMAKLGDVPKHFKPPDMPLRWLKDRI